MGDLARAIDRDYAGRVPVLVGVLTGAAIFMADLIRKMQIPVEMEFMAVSSYGAGTESTGVVRILNVPSDEVIEHVVYSHPCKPPFWSVH